MADAVLDPARRGIWDPDKQHYPDYEERKRWWDGRAEVIRAFEAEAAGHDDYVQLTRLDALDRLERKVGKEVVVLGSVAEIRPGERGPTIVKLSRHRGDDFPLVFFDKEAFAASHIAERAGEYVRVRGVVSRYQDDRRGRSQLEIRIDGPGQILP